MDRKMLAIFKRPIYETIDAVCTAKERKEKVRILQEASSPTLKAFLSYLFDPFHTFSFLPKGDPPFGSSVPRGQEGTDDIRFELHRHLFPDTDNNLDFIFVLTDRGRGNLSRSAVQSHFERLVRSLHPQDVPSVIMMKDKEPPVGLTRKVVAEAFPALEAKWLKDPADDEKPKRGRPSTKKG